MIPRSKFKKICSDKGWKIIQTSRSKIDFRTGKLYKLCQVKDREQFKSWLQDADINQ